jgi:CheY-like chemotaxis protein
MTDFNVAIDTTVLLVDDDICQLDLRSLVLKMSGFAVLPAASPIEALSLLAQPRGHKVNVCSLLERSRAGKQAASCRKPNSNIPSVPKSQARNGLFDA